MSGATPRKKPAVPRPVALIDPWADWTRTARRSRAQRGGLSVLVARMQGVWCFDVLAEGDPRPLMSGGSAHWTREDAEARATREAERILQQRARGSPRPPGRKLRQGPARPQSLLL